MFGEYARGVLYLIRFERAADLARIEGIVCRWYIFGSTARGEMSPSDVDLLAVVADSQDAFVLRNVLRDWLKGNPVHLVIMSEVEEKETKFIVSVGALHIPFGGWL